MSFDGTHSIGLWPTTFCPAHGGNLSEASVTPVKSAELPRQLADWLAGYNLATIFLVDVTGLPGLTAAEATLIDNSDAGRLQSISSSLTEDVTRQVVQALRTNLGYRTFQDALTDRPQPRGVPFCARFREVLAGEAELLDVPQHHV